MGQIVSCDMKSVLMTKSDNRFTPDPSGAHSTRAGIEETNDVHIVEFRIKFASVNSYTLIHNNWYYRII